MSDCEGLHCPGCGQGGGKAALVVVGIGAAVLAVEWIAGHLWEVIAVTVVCVALAVAFVLWLFRWAARRDALHAAERPFLIAREASAAVTSAERRAVANGDIHLHFHDMTAADAAEVTRRAIGG